MNSIENTYICLAAPLLLAILVMQKDGRSSLSFVLAGMTASLLSAYITTFLAGAAGVDAAIASHEIAPAVEETMKCLPLVFYLLVFEPEKRFIIPGTLMVAVGFATFENVCYLTSYGTEGLMRVLVRGFGTGAMHVLCGVIMSLGFFLLWDRIWLQTFGGFALLSFVITIHAIFNVLVNQEGPVFWVGSAIPLTAVLVYLLVFRRKVDHAQKKETQGGRNP